MLKQISLTCALLFLIFVQMKPATAQQNARELSAAEQAVAEKINCADFTKLPDGRWKSGPNAPFASNSIFPVGGLNFGGADLGTVLEKKCGGQRL